MANKETEGKFVWPLVLGCLAAIVVFHLVYLREFKELTADPLFLIMDIGFVAGYIGFSIKCIKSRWDYKFDWTRWATIILAVAVCVWIGVWCSDRRAKKSEGIEYQYKK